MSERENQIETPEEETDFRKNLRNAGLVIKDEPEKSESPEEEKEETKDEAPKEPEDKPEDKGEKAGEEVEDTDELQEEEPETLPDFLKSVPDKFIVKGEEGQVDVQATIDKLSGSYTHLSKKIGKQGQELGETRKKKKELEQKLKELEEGKGDYDDGYTDEDLEELSYRDPDKYSKIVKSRAQKDAEVIKNSESEKQQIRQKLIGIQIGEWFEVNDKAQPYEDKIAELVKENGEQVNDRIKEDGVPATLSWLYAESLRMENESLKNKTDANKEDSYKPKPPAAERPTHAGKSRDRNKVKISGRQRELAKQFGIEDDEEIIKYIKGEF